MARLDDYLQDLANSTAEIEQAGQRGGRTGEIAAAIRNSQRVIPPNPLMEIAGPYANKAVDLGAQGLKYGVDAGANILKGVVTGDYTPLPPSPSAERGASMFGVRSAANASDKSAFARNNTSSIMFNPLVKPQRDLATPVYASQQQAPAKPTGRVGGVRKAAPTLDENGILVQRGLTTSQVGFQNGVPVESGPINDTFEAQLQRARNIDSEGAAFDTQQAAEISKRTALDLLNAEANARENMFNAGIEDFQPTSLSGVAGQIAGRNVPTQAAQGIAQAEAQRINGAFGVQAAGVQAGGQVAAARLQAADKIQTANALAELMDPNTTPARAAFIKDAFSSLQPSGRGARGAGSDLASGRTFLNTAFANGMVQGVTPADQAFALSLVDRGLASPEGALAEVYKKVAARQQAK